MADYVSIIAKAVDALADNTPANRAIIYDKARATIDRKLRTMAPPPSESAIRQQLDQLESAIAEVETGYAAAAAEPQVAPQPSPPVQPVPSPVAERPPVSPAVSSSLPDVADTVILIDGIGEKTQQNLAEEGITRLSQIAAMDDASLAALTAKIGIPGFEKTQAWKQQASDLLAGGIPRSKTDQDRLQRIVEEAMPQTSSSPVAAAGDTSRNADRGEASAEHLYAAQPGISAAEDKARPGFEPPASRRAPEPTAPMEPSPGSTPPSSTPFAPARPHWPEAHTPQVSTDHPGPVPDPGMPDGLAPAVPADETRGKPREAGAASVKAPRAPEPQPDFVSQLENDPGARSAAPITPQKPPARRPAPPARKGSAGKVAGWTAVLALIAGAAAGAWYYQDEVKRLAGQAGDLVSELVSGGEQSEPAGSTGASESAPENTGSGQKDTTRLGTNGKTVAGEPAASDPPADASQAEPETQTPAGTGIRDVTQGEQAAPEVVSVDEPPADSGGAEPSGEPSQAAEAEPAQTPAQTPQIAVIEGENAYLYEENFGSSGASRDEGSVAWSLSTEPPETGAAPEPVIRGVVDIPSRGLQLNLAIKRNVDPALPASHIIELLFTVQPGFSGGNVDQVSRFVMKGTEQARGESLVGVPARIDAGFFLIALNNLEQAQQTNLNLLENGAWVDLPLSYLAGRRGLITLEKGPTGEQVFKDALADWANR